MGNDKIKPGIRMYHAICDDGKAIPEHCFLVQHGTVDQVLNKGIVAVRFKEKGLCPIFRDDYDYLLKPNRDGFAYYVPELKNMDDYPTVLIGGVEAKKIPSKTLREHENPKK